MDQSPSKKERSCADNPPTRLVPSDATLFCSRGNGCGRAGTGAKVCTVVEGTNRFVESGVVPPAFLDKMAGEEDEVANDAIIRDC